MNGSTKSAEGAGRRGPVVRSATVAVLVAALLAGCQKQPGDNLNAAKARIKANQAPAAIIELKNVLRSQPQNAEARFLLGQQLAATGDPAGAVAEFQRALDAKYPMDQLAAPYAEALLAAGQPGQVIVLFNSTALEDPAKNAALATWVANANLLMGDLPAAQQAIDRALKSVPDHPPAVLAKARVRVGRGDLPAALQLADELLAKSPEDAAVWTFKGELLDRDPATRDQALEAYNKALQFNPKQLQALSSVLAIQLIRNDLPKAQDTLAKLRAAAPNGFLTNYYDARLKFLSGNFQAARPLFQALLNDQPDNATVLLASGVNELRLKAPLQAEAQLSRAVTLQPGSGAARYYLAQAYLQLGKPEQATSVLSPLINTATPAPQPLLVAAQARLMQGDAKGADALFDRAAKLHSSDASVRIAMALMTAAKGETDAAVNELQRISETSDGTEADLRLISARLARNELDAALTALDALEKKQPGLASTADLRGQVLRRKNDLAGARLSFEQAFKRDARYLPAVVSLADLDAADKKPEAGRKRLDELAAADPNNASVHLAIAAFAARQGASAADVTKIVETAVRVDPRDISARLLLIERHFNAGHAETALGVAQTGVTANPDNIQLLDALARSQVRSGDSRQALTTYAKLVRLAPKEPAGYLGKANALINLKDVEAAAKSVQQLLELSPGHPDAARLAIGLAIQRKQFDQGVSLARQMQQQHPKEGIGHALEADVLIAQNQWGPAADALRTGITKGHPEALVPRLHQVLLKDNRSKDADELINTWLAKNPQDTVVLKYLGDSAQQANNSAEAIKRYQQLVKLKPNDPGFLNNLAWLLMQAGQPGALALAERAANAVPGNASVLDTLAQAYAAEKNFDKAANTLLLAMARTPDPAPLRLSLAKVYIQAGDRRKAVTELEALRDLGKAFPQQAEVQTLLAAQRRQ